MNMEILHTVEIGKSYLVGRNHHNTITNTFKTASQPKNLTLLISPEPENAEVPEFNGCGDVALSETFPFFPGSDVEGFDILMGIPVAEENAVL